MRDTKLFDLIEKEKIRQTEGIELIASENYASCLLYTSQSPRDKRQSRMPSSA